MWRLATDLREECIRVLRVYAVWRVYRPAADLRTSGDADERGADDANDDNVYDEVNRFVE